MRKDDNQVLTIKEQQTVELLMNEVQGRQTKDYRFRNISNEEISEMLELEPKANNLDPVHYRYNIAFRQEYCMDDFDVMEILEGGEVIVESDDESEEENVAKPQEAEPARVVAEERSELDAFNEEELSKLKFDKADVTECKYPRVRDMDMSENIYPSVSFAASEVDRWFKYNKKGLECIKDCVVFTREDIEYQMFIMDDQLYVFHNKNDFREPIVINPAKGKAMNKIAVSTCFKYFALALKDELLLYEIKGTTLNMVLLKNITDLKGVNEITHLGFYGDKHQKLYFIAGNKYLHLVSINSALFFLRVDVQKMDICLTHVTSIDTVKYSIDADFFYLFALSSGTETAIYMVEPIQQLLHLENFEDDLIKAKLQSNVKANLQQIAPVSTMWKYKPGLKPQLIITFWNRVLVLRLLNLSMMPLQWEFAEFARLHRKSQILSAGLLSYNHLLIHTKESIVVVAMPLMPSVSDAYEDSYVSYINRQSYSRVFPVMAYRQLALSNKVSIIQLNHLRQYVEKTLLEASDHRLVFNLLLLIAKQLNFSFDFTYNESDLSNLIFRAVEAVLESIEKVDAGANIFQIKIYWICELLVESHRETILWGLVFSTLRKQNKLSVFLDCIELFILQEQLTEDIPSDTLSTIIPYFCGRNRQKTLLKALLRVDFQSHDVDKYLQTIGEKQMYSLYIYLFQNFSQDELDFLTPFVKLFSSFRQSFEGRLPDTDYKGKLCIWYLYKCFKGQKFPHTPMEPLERNKTILSLSVEILNPTFLKRLIQFNPSLTFQVLLHIFINQQNMQIISQNEAILLQKFHGLYPDQPIYFLSFQATALQALKKMTPKPILVYFYYFIALICQYNGKIRMETMFESTECLLSELSENNMVKLYCFRKGTIRDVGQLCIIMIRIIKDFIVNNKIYLKRLVNIRCDLNNVKSYLNYIGGDYRASVTLLLQSKEQKNTIFELVDYITNDIKQDPNKLSDFIEHLRSHLSELTQLDARATLKIFRNQGYDQGKLLRDLRKKPELKFEMLHAIIIDNELKNRDQEIQQLCEHLELACQLYPYRIMEFMNLIKYPLDEGILICEKNSQFQGKANLQQKAGDIVGALKSRCNAIQDILKSKNQKQRHLKARLANHINQCILLCKNHYSPADGDNYWIILLQIVKELQTTGNRQKVSLMLQLQKHFANILRMMYSYVPLAYLNSYFIGPKSSDFSQKVCLYSWDVLHRLNKFDIRLLLKVIDIYKLDLVEFRGQFNTKRTAALHTQSTICNLCDNSLQTERLLVMFNCNHICHRICQKQNVCMTCQFESDEQHFFIEVQKKEIRQAKGQLKILPDDPKMRPSPPKPKPQEDIYVVQIDDGAERKRKVKHRMKKFDIDLEQDTEKVNQYFDGYFNKDKKQPQQPQPQPLKQVN